MKRREFIRLLGGAATWPLAARAQQQPLPVIGFLSSGVPDPQAFRVRMLRQGFSEAGYVEGRNLAIEYHWAENHNDRLPELAGNLVRRQVRVIVTLGGQAALAAKAATTTIPIVFSMPNDPVKMGLVASLNRPGGNVTGVTNLDVEVGPKRLELMHELVPGARSIALLLTSTYPDTQSPALQAAACTLGLDLPILRVSEPRDLDTSSPSLARLQASALVIGNDAFLNGQSEQLAALTHLQSVPAISSRSLCACALMPKSRPR